MAATGLVGRGHELELLADVLGEAQRARGSALMLVGAPGVGKTALLRDAAERAQSSGFTVVQVTGVSAEVSLPLAALSQLLSAVSGVSRDPQASAVRDLVLEAAHREVNGEPLQYYRLALSALGALTELACRQPLAVIVDDAHWIDEMSWNALAFAGRRIAADPLVILGAGRDEAESDRRLAASGLPTLRIEPLDAESSAVLLDRVTPGLSSRLRERVLREAAGNALALLDLPATALSPVRTSAFESTLPLTHRLENNYWSAVLKLPADTRALLLVLALSDNGDPVEACDAGTIMLGHDVSTDAVLPAVDARLVILEGPSIAFRHPLVRSAIRQRALTAQLIAAHGAIADSVGRDTDRGIWHRGLAATTPDDVLAKQVADVAARMRRQGSVASVQAWQLAARLSRGPSLRASSLVWAATSASESGDRETVGSILAQIDESGLHPREHAQLAWLRASRTIESFSAPVALELADIADKLAAAGEPELAADSLTTVAIQCYWTPPDSAARQRLRQAIQNIGLPASDTRLLCAKALVAPIEEGRAVLAQLADASRAELTADQLFELGLASSALGAAPAALGFLDPSISALREGHRLGKLAQALLSQAFEANRLGETRLALRAAQECRLVSLDCGQPHWAAHAQLCEATAEALRGNTDTARALADEVEASITTSARRPMLALVQVVRGSAYLADGHFATALQEFLRLADPDDPRYQPYIALGCIGHIAEAAVLAGEPEAARAWVLDAELTAQQCQWPAVRSGLALARVLLVDDSGLGTAYAAPVDADLHNWVFDRARTELAYGSRLRRLRRPADSRAHFRAAEQAFVALGVTPWAERARRELRATGETIRASTDARSQLTAQELHIAELAADGLSNREIANQLFLSPRTVSTHLYRVFPKLGVRNRRELARLFASSVTADV